MLHSAGELPDASGKESTDRLPLQKKHSSGPCHRPRTQVAFKGDLVRSSCTGTRSL